MLELLNEDDHGDLFFALNSVFLIMPTEVKVVNIIKEKIKLAERGWRVHGYLF